MVSSVKYEKVKGSDGPVPMSLCLAVKMFEVLFCAEEQNLAPPFVAWLTSVGCLPILDAKQEPTQVVLAGIIGSYGNDSDLISITEAVVVSEKAVRLPLTVTRLPMRVQLRFSAVAVPTDKTGVHVPC